MSRARGRLADNQLRLKNQSSDWGNSLLDPFEQQLRRQSSTRLPDDQSWLKHYFLKKRIGFRDPVEKQFCRDFAKLARSSVDGRQ